MSHLLTVVLLTTFLARLIGVFIGDESQTLAALTKIQANINANSSAYCYHGHSGTKQAFITNKYTSFAGSHNVLVYPFCLVTHELGNKLGNFFSELGCAQAAGMHFMSVHHQWDIAGSFHGNATNATYSSDKHKLAFLNALPSIVVHKNPLDRFSVEKKLHHDCKCTRYCWEHGNAAWVNRTQLIGHYIRKAVSAYLDSVDTSLGTSIDPEVDISNAVPGQLLPIIPQVALQYRCGDNIGFSYMYGILPFTAFDNLIPAGTKTIYVLSDHPSRAVHSPYSGRCATILQTLFTYLSGKHPTATIVVKRGGDIFMDYVRLSRANVTICSASSFCLWPAIANTQAQVYFPLTMIAAGADSIQQAPKTFGPHFHWIEKPGIISNFKNMRPWTAVLDVLTGKTATA